MKALRRSWKQKAITQRRLRVTWNMLEKIGNTFTAWTNTDYLKTSEWYGAWVAQSAKHPTLGFSWGHELRVVRWILALGSTLSVEPL